MMKCAAVLSTVLLSGFAAHAFASSQYEYAQCHPRNPVFGEYNYLNLLGEGPYGAVRMVGVTGVMFSGNNDQIEEKATITTNQLYIADGSRYSQGGMVALVSAPGTGNSVIIENYTTGRVRSYALDAIFVPSERSNNESITIRYIDLNDELKTFTTTGCYFSNAGLVTRAPHVQY